MLDISPEITAYILCMAALLGLALGSFICCAAGRIGRGESFVSGRSRCAACGHTLAARDLVPVASYLFLRGKCRYCGARIPAQALWAELIMAAVFVSVVLRYDVSARAAGYMFLGVLLLGTALVDLATGLIPDGFILAGIAGFVLVNLFSPQPLRALGAGLVSGLAVAVPLTLIVLLMDRVLKRESMGGGDIKLLFMTGLYYDWKIGILLLIFSCIFGIIFAKLAEKRQGAEFPFGPAIAAGAWAAALCGPQIVSWYLGLF